MAYVGRSPRYGFLEGQTATFNGSTTVVTLQRNVSSTDAIDVYIDNVHQEPDVAYTLSSGGNSITFTGTPDNGAVLYIRFHGITFDTTRAYKLVNSDEGSSLILANNDTLTLSLDGTTALTATSSGITIPNLTVTGTTTSVNSTNLNIGDNKITLNSDVASNAAPSENAGITINRGSSTDVDFIWNETNDEWYAANDLATGGIFRVKGGGTTPTLLGSTLAAFTRSAATNNASIAIIGNSGGFSSVHFGDENDADVGQLDYSHTADTFALNKGLGVTGNIAVSGTVDGVDIAARDGVLTSTTTTAGAALPKSGGTLTGDVTFNTQLGIGAAPHATASLNITNTNQHIRFNNGSELGVIALLSSGELELWGHGANESINFRTGSGTGNIAMNIVGNNVGIGTSSIDGTLHVHTASAGTVTASSQADDLVVENNTEGGMTIITPDDQSARIRFTSPSTNNDVGGATIFYRQNINKMNIGTGVAGGILSLQSGAANETMILDADGNVGINTASPTDSSWGGGNTEFAIDGGTGYAVTHFRSTYGTPAATRFSQGVGGGNFYMAYDDVNAAHRMVINALGYAGINTSNPTVGLEISGTGNASRIKLIDGSAQINIGLWDGSNYRMEGDSNRKILITSYHTDGVHIGNSGASNLVIKGGNVGIGSDPTAKFSVYSAASGVVARIDGPNAYNAESGLEFSVGRARISGVLESGGGTPGAYLKFMTMPNGGSVTERLRLDSAGDLSLMTDGADIKLYYTEPRTFITNSGASVTIKQIDNNANAAYIDFASWTNSSLMRIMNSGVVKVGKTTTALSDAGHQFGPDGYVYHTRTGNIMWLNTLSSGSAITFAATGVTKGNIVIASAGTTYNTTSDRRLKENIQPIADATDKLMAMKPVTHTWIADPEADAVHGFIAQEMQEIVPEAISGDADSDEMMSMDYGRITPVLVAALQEATNEIKALKQRVSELEEL